MPGRLSRADTSWRFYRAIASGRRQYHRPAALAQPVTVAFVLMLVGARAFPEAALVRARSDVQRRATIIALPGDENDPDGSAAIVSAQRPTFNPGLSRWSNVGVVMRCDGTVDNRLWYHVANRETATTPRLWLPSSGQDLRSLRSTALLLHNS